MYSECFAVCTFSVHVSHTNCVFFFFFFCTLTPERRIPKASKPEQKETLSAHRVQQDTIEVDENKTPEEKYCAMDGQVGCSNKKKKKILRVIRKAFKSHFLYV